MVSPVYIKKNILTEYFHRRWKVPGLSFFLLVFLFFCFSSVSLFVSSLFLFCFFGMKGRVYYYWVGLPSPCPLLSPPPPYYRLPNSYGESGPISSSSFLACDRWKKSGRMRILRREGERERRGDDVPDARGV